MSCVDKETDVDDGLKGEAFPFAICREFAVGAKALTNAACTERKANREIDFMVLIYKHSFVSVKYR